VGTIVDLTVLGWSAHPADPAGRGPAPGADRSHTANTPFHDLPADFRYRKTDAIADWFVG
jgi:hypothetical protein